MAQFKRQPPPPPRAAAFPGNPQMSLLGPPPGLLTPPVSAELLQGPRHPPVGARGPGCPHELPRHAGCCCAAAAGPPPAPQAGDKQRVFTGIVSSLHDYFGVVDDEVFFQFSVVKGRIPQIGEKVLVKAAYNPNQAVPWNAIKVQTLPNQPLLKAPLMHVASLGQKQGILGPQPQMLFQPPRIPRLFPQKSVNIFSAPPSLPVGHPGRYPGRGPKGRNEPGRWDDFDSKKRKQKGAEPWAVKKPRHEVPQYRVHFARYAVDSPFCDAMEILRRYSSIQLPHGFYDIRLRWLEAFPLTRPLRLHRRSRIVLAKPEEAPEQADAPAAAPQDADPAFSAKVLLLSSPGLEEFYRTCLSCIDDSSEQKEVPEHPTKQMKFLLAKKEDEVVLIGGEWSPSLDGPDPEGDPMVLVRTAIRCTKAQAGLDLSNCTQWVRFAEFSYLREGEPSQREVVVVFLPDVWGCMPSMEQWEASCRPKAGKTPSPVPGDQAATETGATERDAAADAALEPVPVEPAVVARPRPGQQDACSNISLFTLLESGRRRERLSFEVALVAELFQEMLQRDFGYTLYKALLALPEKEEPLEARNVEPERAPEPAKEAAPEAAPEAGPEAAPEAAAANEEAEQHPPKSEPGHTEAERPADGEAATAAGEQETSKSECKGDPKDSPDDLCALSLPDGLLLLPEEEEEELGAKLEDAEVRSTASNQSEMEFSSLQDVPKDLDPSAVLPLDALLAFVYFDSNFCGYLHRRDLEKILLTLGLHLCKEQVKCLVNRVVTQYVCQYRNLRYGRHEGSEAGGTERVPEEQQLGNLPLLSPARPPGTLSPPPPADAEQGGLVSHKGRVLNVGKLLEKVEQAESSCLYMEGKIHTLEAKLEESQSRLATTESTNKTLTTELRELQRRLAEVEEQARVSEKQKLHFQRLLQEHRKRLAPVQQELQSIIEKTDNCLGQDLPSSN